MGCTPTDTLFVSPQPECQSVREPKRERQPKKEPKRERQPKKEPKRETAKERAKERETAKERARVMSYDWLGGAGCTPSDTHYFARADEPKLGHQLMVALGSMAHLFRGAH